MLSTQLRRERSYCTTRRSCCQMETSGNQKSQPLPVQMRHTDNGEESVQAGRTVYIGGVVTSDAAGRISFVQPYTSTYSSRHRANQNIWGLTNCTCDTEKIEYRGSQIAHSILRRVDRFSEDVMIFKLYMRQTLL
jgi:hypothetical protein